MNEACASDCPPRFANALRYAVFPGGARVRPKLVEAVAHACGNADMQRSRRAQAAIEMLHCASLVHDDLPCFDGAAYRRGKPSVHVAFGERLAVLVGDALIVEAFATTAMYPQIARIIAASVGAPERHLRRAGLGMRRQHGPRASYQRAKTGALVCRLHHGWRGRRRT